LLRSRFFSATFARFMADFVLGTRYSLPDRMDLDFT
jgi:hypothetical protein